MCMCMIKVLVYVHLHSWPGSTHEDSSLLPVSSSGLLITFIVSILRAPLCLFYNHIEG